MPDPLIVFLHAFDRSVFHSRFPFFFIRLCFFWIFCNTLFRPLYRVEVYVVARVTR